MKKKEYKEKLMVQETQMTLMKQQFADHIQILGTSITSSKMIIEGLSAEVNLLREREDELMSLVDGAKEVVELYGIRTVPTAPYGKQWSKEWVGKADRLIHERYPVDSIY